MALKVPRSLVPGICHQGPGLAGHASALVPLLLFKLFPAARIIFISILSPFSPSQSSKDCSVKASCPFRKPFLISVPCLPKVPSPPWWLSTLGVCVCVCVCKAQRGAGPSFLNSPSPQWLELYLSESDVDLS